MARIKRAEAQVALYRLFDYERRLLYIGIAWSPLLRWKQHEREKAWWEEVHRFALEWYPSLAEAQVAEADAIFAEQPLHNGVGKRRRLTVARLEDEEAAAHTLEAMLARQPDSDEPQRFTQHISVPNIEYATSLAAALRRLGFFPQLRSQDISGFPWVVTVPAEAAPTREAVWAVHRLFDVADEEAGLMHVDPPEGYVPHGRAS